MVEIVLPTGVVAGVRERRRLRARFTDDVAQPVHAHPGGMARGGPYRPTVGGRANRELLGRHGADDLAQAAVVLGPHVVGGSNRRYGHGAHHTAVQPAPLSRRLTGVRYNRMVVSMNAIGD